MQSEIGCVPRELFLENSYATMADPIPVIAIAFSVMIVSSALITYFILNATLYLNTVTNISPTHRELQKKYFVALTIQVSQCFIQSRSYFEFRPVFLYLQLQFQLSLCM